MPNGIKEAKIAQKTLLAFMWPWQLAVVTGLCRGEEGQFFIDKMVEYADRIDKMPKTYEQDGKGDEAIAYLHYFYGGCDWYITEKDAEFEQHQAYGVANLGHGPELGYISIEELKQNKVELDLHWTPKPLKDIKKCNG